MYMGAQEVGGIAREVKRAGVEVKCEEVRATQLHHMQRQYGHVVFMEDGTC